MEHTPESTVRAMQERGKARERHIEVGQYLKDTVYAANDGIVTTFAVVAGVAGAALSPAIILILGIANLVADGFSMATGNYLGTKSERDFYKKEEASEWEEIKKLPDVETEEVRGILQKKGYEGAKLEQLTALIVENKQFWVDFMMHEEIKLLEPSLLSPLKHAGVTFISFIIAGALPLAPYVLFNNAATFGVSALFAGIALFIVGALRTFFSQRSWLISGAEMLMIGGFAGAIAYALGFFIRMLVG